MEMQLTLLATTLAIDIDIIRQLAERAGTVDLATVWRSPALQAMGLMPDPIDDPYFYQKLGQTALLPMMKDELEFRGDDWTHYVKTMARLGMWALEQKDPGYPHQDTTYYLLAYVGYCVVESVLEQAKDWKLEGARAEFERVLLRNFEEGGHDQGTIKNIKQGTAELLERLAPQATTQTDSQVDEEQVPSAIFQAKARVLDAIKDLRADSETERILSVIILSKYLMIHDDVKSELLVSKDKLADHFVDDENKEIVSRRIEALANMAGPPPTKLTSCKEKYVFWGGEATERIAKALSSSSNEQQCGKLLRFFCWPTTKAEGGKPGHLYSSLPLAKEVFREMFIDPGLVHLIPAIKLKREELLEPFLSLARLGEKRRLP